MIEEHIKEALINAIKNSENVIIVYPITENVSNKKAVGRLVLVYSIDPFFANKIYIVEIDESVNVLNIKEPFARHYSDQAIEYIFNLYNSITNSYKDDQDKYTGIINKGLKLTDLIIDKKAEMKRVKAAIDNLYK